MKRRRLDPSAPVIFLDFDGVLHPDCVFRVPGRGLVLRAEGHQLFESAPILEEILSPYPEIQIVLSTSWVRILGFDRTMSRLPACLGKRVVGATWHSRMDQQEWIARSRCEQVLHYATRHSLRSWLAIDDDDEHWPSAWRHALVYADGDIGLKEARVQNELKRRLQIDYLRCAAAVQTDCRG